MVQGDPSAVPQIVENIKDLLGRKPMFGICMGHQILGQVAGPPPAPPRRTAAEPGPRLLPDCNAMVAATGGAEAAPLLRPLPAHA